MEYSNYLPREISKTYCLDAIYPKRWEYCLRGLLEAIQMFIETQKRLSMDLHHIHGLCVFLLKDIKRPYVCKQILAYQNFKKLLPFISNKHWIVDKIQHLAIFSVLDVGHDVSMGTAGQLVKSQCRGQSTLFYRLAKTEPV